MAAAKQRMNPRFIPAVRNFKCESIMAGRWEEHPLHTAPVQLLLKYNIAVWTPDFQNIWQVAWSAEQECSQRLD